MSDRQCEACKIVDSDVQELLVSDPELHSFQGESPTNLCPACAGQWEAMGYRVADKDGRA